MNCIPRAVFQQDATVSEVLLWSRTEVVITMKTRHDLTFVRSRQATRAKERREQAVVCTYSIWS